MNSKIVQTLIRMNSMKCVAVAVGLAATAGSAEAKEQPNIIMIMCDDLGWGDVGFNGNEIIKTPNIDKLASEGVIYDRFYAACAVSSPTRASVLTGRNPYRTGIFNANVGILRPEEITLPELLREEGYATGHFGKWHLGALTDKEKDSNRGAVGNTKELNLPRDHGYDEAFVTESKVPTWDPMIFPTEHRNGSGWNCIKPGEPTSSFGSAYWDINGEKVTENLEGDDSRVIMDRVLPFIEQSSDSERPFLSVVWFHAPHKPCVAGEEYAAMYGEYDEAFMNYAGCITALDDQVGRLCNYLEENGLLENTIITFCSDNGPENGVGVTGGFRARKRSLYEGGVRVPSFIYWKGHVKEPYRIEVPTVTCDYLPTMVSIVGVESSKCKYELDGVDISPSLKGKRITRENPIVLNYAGQIAYYGDNYKLYTKGATKEYYDIVNDPYEKNPLNSCPDMESTESTMNSTYNRYRMSFEGAEYGVESVNRMEQSWPKGRC